MTALTDKNRLLFGAGFAFGVTATLVILATATLAVADSGGQEVILTLAAGAFFAGVVGTTLFLLAFPENRVDVPVERLFGGDEER